MKAKRTKVRQECKRKKNTTAVKKKFLFRFKQLLQWMHTRHANKRNIQDKVQQNNLKIKRLIAKKETQKLL